MMKKWRLPVTSLLANMYYVLAWVYVSGIFETHQERVDAFLRFIPPGFSNGFLSALLIVLSLISIVMVSNTNTKAWVKTGFTGVQGFFIFLQIWQWM